MQRWRVEKCRAKHTLYIGKCLALKHPRGMEWVAYSQDNPDVNMWFRDWKMAFSYALVMIRQNY
jgi:hypothetical protein